MATSNKMFSLNSFPKIDSLPNLRLLCNLSSEVSHSTTEAAAIYRSSKPDRITETDLNNFRNLNIKCIIDFRSKQEYKATDGNRILDKEYIPYKVIVPKENYQPGQSVKYERVLLKGDTKNNSNELNFETKTKKTSNANKEGGGINNEEKEKRHYLINFFTFRYLKTVFNRLPWYLWCLGILHLVWDIVTCNKFKTFRKFIAEEAISTWGMFGQYVDIIEVSQPAICSALKLISDPENLPALINCAYGKDRTGIMSALILMSLGMPKEYIAEEYAKSTEGLDPIRRLVHSEIVGKHYLSEEFCRSEANTMRDLVSYIEDRYLTVEQYMTSIGFTEQEQRQLKNNLEALKPRVP